VRPGGAMIMFHPVPNEFHQVHHPSYVDFFEEVLSETTDPSTIESKYEERYATDPWYVHLYRKSYAYHGVHPFYMWYWGAHALDYLGDVPWEEHPVAKEWYARLKSRPSFRPLLADHWPGTTPPAHYANLDF
jgi:hypothetical protein